MSTSSSSRRSFLQLEILVRLSRGPVKTATELAESINSKRPAVSRSLKTLRQRGLVQKGKGGWELTDAGRTEAGEASARVAEVFEAARKMAASTIWDWPGFAVEEEFRRQMLSIQQALASNVAAVSAAFDMRQLFENVVPPALFQSLAPPTLPRDLVDTRWMAEQLLESLSEVMQPVLDIQAQYSSFMADVVLQEAFKPVGELIARTNALVAGALENIQAVGFAAQVRAVPLDEVLYPGVADQLLRVGQSYKGLLDSQITRLADSHRAFPPDLVWRGITLPSVTLTSYTRSLRWQADALNDQPISLDQLDFEQGAGAQLDDLLRSLDPQFVDMRHGSWQALHSNNPDRVRHAAVSYRELVRQVLALLAPEPGFDRDRPGSKMKAAVQRLLGGSERSADFAIAVSTAVHSLYNYLNKPTHANYRHAQAVRAALVAGEGLLLFVLVHHASSDTR